MAYLHIDNLYSNQDILLFRECYASEKIHGTSAHVGWKNKHLVIFAGGAKHEDFLKLFDLDVLTMNFLTLGYPDITFYGEAYGGKLQGMRDTYGSDLKFIVFDVKIDDNWLNVPDAESLADRFGFEFVSYKRIPCTIEAIDAERDAPSVQAMRILNVDDKIREGVVLRPIIEVIKKNGTRIIAKHKRDEFRETKTPRVPVEKVQMIADAVSAAEEWVTPMRLQHVLDKFPGRFGMEITGDVIRTMLEDVYREGGDEVEPSHELNKAIGRKTAMLFKEYLKIQFNEPGDD